MLSTPAYPQHAVNVATVLARDVLTRGSKHHEDQWAFAKADHSPAASQPRAHEPVFSIRHENGFMFRSVDPGVFASFNNVLKTEMDENRVRFQGFAVAPIVQDGFASPQLTVQVKGVVSFVNTGPAVVEAGDCIVWDYPTAAQHGGRFVPAIKTRREFDRDERWGDATRQRALGTCLRGGGPGHQIDILVGDLRTH